MDFFFLNTIIPFSSLHTSDMSVCVLGAGGRGQELR